MLKRDIKHEKIMDDWYTRDEEGAITGHTDKCAYPGCPDNHEEGGVRCEAHEAEAKMHNAHDRNGWGIPA